MQCVWDHCHVEKFLPCQPSCDWLSPFIQYLVIQTYVHSAIYTCLPLHFLYSCSPISAHSHLHVSWSALCSHCGSPSQVHAKHFGPHLIQTNLFWFHLTKECAANSHQASSHLLWQSLILQFCSILWAMIFFLDVVCRGWLHAMSFTLSELTLKHQFPQIILVPSQRHLPISFQCKIV